MKIYYLILLTLRKFYLIIFSKKQNSFIVEYDNVINDADVVSEKIYDLLISNKPCMIARFGVNESEILSNYIGINSNYRSILNFIKVKCPPWWWEKSITRNFNLIAGFFPIEISLLEKYCKLVLSDIPLIDILGTWANKDRFFDKIGNF